MQSVKFEGANLTLKAKGCNDLPAFNDGLRTVTAWTFTPEEWEKLQETKTVYLSIHFGQSQPPVALSVESPLYKSKDAFCLICYQHIITEETKIVVWNPIDQDAPQAINCDLGAMKRAPGLPTYLLHINEPKPGDYWLCQDPNQNGQTVLVKILDVNNWQEKVWPLPEQPKSSSIITI